MTVRSTSLWLRLVFLFLLLATGHAAISLERYEKAQPESLIGGIHKKYEEWVDKGVDSHLSYCRFQLNLTGPNHTQNMLECFKAYPSLYCRDEAFWSGLETTLEALFPEFGLVPAALNSIRGVLADAVAAGVYLALSPFTSSRDHLLHVALMLSLNHHLSLSDLLSSLVQSSFLEFVPVQQLLTPNKVGVGVTAVKPTGGTLYLAIVQSWAALPSQRLAQAQVQVLQWTLEHVPNRVIQSGISYVATKLVGAPMAIFAGGLEAMKAYSECNTAFLALNFLLS